jgi:ferric-dicitrate binding protein FerR (iron transport regulator)
MSKIKLNLRELRVIQKLAKAREIVNAFTGKGRTALSHKFIAVVAAVAVLTSYSLVGLATPGARSGALSVLGDVAVNGEKAISGGTIFSDSAIVTAERSSAIVSLSRLGRIELPANSNLRLSFSGNTISGLLDAGGARVSTPAGVSVNLATKAGAVLVGGSQATSFTVEVENGETVVATEWGLAELTSGTACKLIAAGESGIAGMPLPQQMFARLVTKSNQLIMVNGASAAGGSMILTGATIETPDQVGATVDLGPLGGLDIAPNTKLTLDFDQNGNVKVTLIRGCMILRVKKKANGEVDTSEGTAGKTDGKKGGALDVCFLAGATAAVVNQGAAARAGAQNQTSSGSSGSSSGQAQPGLHGGILAGTVTAVVGVIASVIYVVTHNKDDNPTETVISPTQ